MYTLVEQWKQWKEFFILKFLFIWTESFYHDGAQVKDCLTDIMSQARQYNQPVIRNIKNLTAITIQFGKQFLL